MDGIVLRPGRNDRATERQNVFVIDKVVRCGRRREPFLARFDRVARVALDVRRWIGISRVATDVLQAPLERLDATIIVGRPAAMLVATDAAFKPVHSKVRSRLLTVYRRGCVEAAASRAS